MVRFVLRVSFVLAALALAVAAPVRAGKFELPEPAYRIVDDIYSGDLAAAIEGAHRFQQDQPSHPLGYLLEGEAEWWKIWCTAAEFRYGMSYPSHRSKVSTDQHYVDLGAKTTSLAEVQIAVHDSAEMEFYAGMGDALQARIYSLRTEVRNSARFGVRAREHLLRAVALDPNLSDAYMGIGLYNYYADTLSGVARMLRFFMGIPGGNKQEGVQQLERAIGDGVLTPAEARFYLAINLHHYEQKYEQALEIANLLAEKYPSNPIFHLVRGDLLAKLGRRELAVASYRAASESHVTDPDCDAHIRQLIQASVAALDNLPNASH